MNNYFIATEKMYRPLSKEGFNAAKSAFFKDKRPEYLDDSTIQKWEWLLTQLSGLLSPEEQERLSLFKQSREALPSINPNVLSLTQCLHYFESIYFLHQADDPVFQLSLPLKNKLLSLLQQPLAPIENMCEIGRFNRFEEIITEFRADLDWVMHQLVQYRELMLLRLHDQYNATFNIKNAYKVHVFGLMRELAINKKLGFTQEQQLNDIHLSTHQQANIRKYFNDNYETYFSQYEQKAALQLTQTFLLKLSDHLQQQNIPIDAWEKSGVLISGGFKLQCMPLDRLTSIPLDNHTLYLSLDEHGVLATGILSAPFYLTDEQLGEHAVGIRKALQKPIKKNLSLHPHEKGATCLLQMGNKAPLRVVLTHLPFQLNEGDIATLFIVNEPNAPQSVTCRLQKKGGSLQNHALSRDTLGEHADSIFIVLNECVTKNLSTKQENQVFKLTAEFGYLPQGIQINTVMAFIRHHLRLPEDTDIKSEFSTWVDDHQIDLCIKPRSACLKIVSSFMESLLLREGYFIPFAMLFNNKALTAAPQPRLKQGITPCFLNTTQKLFKSLDKNDPKTVHSFLLQHETPLSWYPALLLNWLQQAPSIQLGLPLRYKTEAQFFELAIQGLYDVIRREKNPDDVNRLLTLIRHDKRYFNQFPLDLLSDRTIALRLVCKNGLSLCQLSSQLKDDEALVQAAIKNDCFSYFYASDRLQSDARVLQLTAEGLSKRLNQPVGRESVDDYRSRVIRHYVKQCRDLFNLGFGQWIPCTPLLTHNDFEAFLSHTNHFNTIDALHALITTPAMSTRQWIYLTQHITPSMLRDIIHARHAQGFYPLPYCDNPAIFSDFHQALSAHDLLSDWESNGYIEVRRLASEQALGPHVPTFITHLTTTKHWGLMYMRYQYTHPAGVFHSADHMASQIKTLNKELGDILRFILCLLITEALIHGIILAFDHSSITKDLLLIFIMSQSCLFIALHYFESRDLNYKQMSLFLPKMFRSVYSACVANRYPTEQNLAKRCEESIFRLQGMDNLAAHIKADHLESLWHSIQNDAIDVDTVSDETLLPYLKKKYPLFNEGNRNQLSFFEVAAIPRKNEHEFSIDTPVHSNTFFGIKRATKTVSILTTGRPEWY